MPTGFSIGPLFVHFYGVIIMIGVVAAAFLAEREAHRRGFDSAIVCDALFWILIAGIIGARLWHIFTPPPSMVEQGITTMYYLTHPLDAINTRLGGLGIPGAVIGGGVALYVFTRRRKMRFSDWGGVAAPGLALGQAIGRWGNFINQEVYGAPTNLPWAIPLDPQHRLPGFEQYSHFHPLFLYESLWNFANMFLMLWMARRYRARPKNGGIFFLFPLGYPPGRLFSEFS